MSSKGNQRSPYRFTFKILTYFNKNKIHYKALVAICIISQEKCKNKLTLLRG